VYTYPKIRLFVEHGLALNAAVTIRDEQAHYLLRVMRIKQGEMLALFNGADGEWRAEVSVIGKKELQLKVLDQLRDYLLPPDIWLCFAPLKFGRIDYLVQKATELGVAKLQPVYTQYTQADRVNLQRLRANAVEAAEQCERVEVPEIAEPIDLPKLLAAWPVDRQLLYGDESGNGVALKDWLAQQTVSAASPHPNPLPVGEGSARSAHANGKALSLGLEARKFDSPGSNFLVQGLGEGQDQILRDRIDKFAILIGPEGGFSPNERHILATKATAVGLGPRILRADTAAIALLSILQCWLGDWQQPPRFLRGERKEEGK
jgi:16S rRNA (uracil1498-N3)-methyltransferase